MVISTWPIRASVIKASAVVKCDGVLGGAVAPGLRDDPLVSSLKSRAPADIWLLGFFFFFFFFCQLHHLVCFSEVVDKTEIILEIGDLRTGD